MFRVYLKYAPSKGALLLHVTDYTNKGMMNIIMEGWETGTNYKQRIGRNETELQALQ